MRVWLYNKLMTLNPPGGVHENSSLLGVPSAKPFIVYSMGTLVPEIVDGNETIAKSLLASIWVHGTPGDYQPIDVMLGEIRVLLEAAIDADIIAARFLSSSDDLRDPEMGTIMRYSRFQLVHATQEV